MQIEHKERCKYFGNVKDPLIEDFNQQTRLIGQLLPEGLDRPATTRLSPPESVIWQKVHQA
jgi:hypothetical protein